MPAVWASPSGYEVPFVENPRRMGAVMLLEERVALSEAQAGSGFQWPQSRLSGGPLLEKPPTLSVRLTYLLGMLCPR